MTEEQKKKNYERVKKWRERHKDDPNFQKKARETNKRMKENQKKKDIDKYKARRLHDKKNYYKRGRKSDINSRARYTEEELNMILAHEIPDKELAEKLGRSVQAIQICRSKLKSGELRKEES